MNRETRLVPYTYKKQTIEVEQPGEWCTCGEGVLTPTDVKETEKTLHDFRGRIDGYSQ
jgi:HTH-type transcriptional regulator/antitoxin MqsA